MGKADSKVLEPFEHVIVISLFLLLTTLLSGTHTHTHEIQTEDEKNYYNIAKSTAAMARPAPISVA